MGQEIERKFLVSGEFRSLAIKSKRIMQGYLSSVAERTVRIRVKGDKGFITIKGIGDNSGTCRFEWEKEIPVNEAHELLNICEPRIIDKMRYFVPTENHTFEVDEFYGENDGLIIAEVELSSKNESIDLPSWLGKEVTGNIKYYNSMLIKYPYKKWDQ